MKDRLSNIRFPTNPTEIVERNDKIGHTEYGQYYYHRTFGKFSVLYRLLSDEKNISDDELVYELEKCMEINGNYDCRIQVDKKGRYKDQGFSAKTYTGLIHFIAKKIREEKLSHNYGYYILCRIADNSDYREKTRVRVQELLNI